MDKSVENLLSKYDSDIVKTLEFVIYDMIQFLEEEIERDELDGRLKYAIDKFERLQ